MIQVKVVTRNELEARKHKENEVEKTASNLPGSSVGNKGQVRSASQNARRNTVQKADKTKHENGVMRPNGKRTLPG